MKLHDIVDLLDFVIFAIRIHLGSKKYFMKFFILSALLAVSSLTVFAQADPIEGTIAYQKGDKRAAIVEVPFPPDIVEGALRDQLAKGGIKEEKLKGMQVFKNARLTTTDGEAADLYFKVERKSRKEENVSIVYLIMGRPGENVGLRPGDDAYRIGDAKAFLGSLKPKAEAHKLERDISKEDDNIKKSEMKLKDLQDEQKTLEKRILELQDKLAQRIKDQEATTAEITRQKESRDAMIGRRVPSN